MMRKYFLESDHHLPPLPPISMEMGKEDDEYTHPYLIPSLLTPKECELLKTLALNTGMTDSMVENGKKENIENIDKSFRSSTTCWLSMQKFSLVHSIFQRIENMVHVSKDLFEDMQVVRYTPGGFFNAHYDQCESNLDYCQKELIRFSQHPRKMTLLIYLTPPEDYEGGETHFPNLSLNCKESQGTAVLFHNLNHQGTAIHPLSLHNGVPVLKGEKWIANIWIRPGTNTSSFSSGLD